MKRQIMKDVLFFQQSSEPATEKDKSLILDLQDTLNAHRDHCVGMAAPAPEYKVLGEDLTVKFTALPSAIIKEKTVDETAVYW